MRKKLFIALLFSALLWTLTGCGQEKTAETTWSTAQMAETLYALQNQSNVEQIDAGEAAFADYLSNYYHLTPEDVSDGTILYAGGTSALEIAVLQMTSPDLADTALTALQTYIEERTGAFTGYLPEEAALLEQSSAVARGPYVALLICEEQQAAQETFNRCFEGAEPPAESPLPQTTRSSAPSAPSQSTAAAPEQDGETAPPEDNPEDGPDGKTGETPDASPDETEKEDTPPAQPDTPAAPPAEAPASAPETPAAVPETPAPEPDTPWSYNNSRLVTAWLAGDWSSLHKRDREILDICDSVIQSQILPEMSNYDKELAIHDWMIAWASYDSDTLNHQQNAQPNPDHDNPYGFLIGKKGICLGYTSTFQLFMDMLGIPCITVNGTAHNGTEEHAWNMVSLDGEWYCVDVTWDDPITHTSVSKITAHLYFNVTSEFLRKRDHQWDESAVSEATATTYAWNPYA